MKVGINDSRAADAKAKSAFYNGASGVHPHGASGARWILPPEADKHCRDTAAGAYEFSEYGNSSGAVA